MTELYADSCWIFEHGFLNKKSGFHDAEFASKVVDSMQPTAKIEGNYLFGFSDGGWFAYNVADTMKVGSIDGVATVASTIMKDSKLTPKPCNKRIFINMRDALTVPLTGGPGKYYFPSRISFQRHHCQILCGWQKKCSGTCKTSTFDLVKPKLRQTSLSGWNALK